MRSFFLVMSLVVSSVAGASPLLTPVCDPVGVGLGTYHPTSSNRLFPYGTRSAYIVFFRSPDDATHFRAYGLDVRSCRVAFYLDGIAATDLVPLLTSFDVEVQRLQLELVAVYGGSYTFTEWGSTGQMGGPQRPPVGPRGFPLTQLQYAVSLAQAMDVAQAPQ